MYCWGSTLHGELGLGGVEHDLIYEPVLSPWSDDASQRHRVAYASCGETHTLFLTRDGRVFSCGSNDHGQLGHDLPTKRPQQLGSLESYRIVLVACGSAHSLAVNEWGQVFGWGGGERGQLGLGAAVCAQPTPKIIRELAVMHAVQIACGHYHSLALMNNGDLYSWGLNENGQLGLGNVKGHRTQENTPVLMQSLAGIPFSHIACGGYHSFAITKSGAVYAWGKNQNGQLGLNDKADRFFPTLLKNFRSIRICKVVCGEDFSIFLSFDGGVFACGSNRYGQLGHGGNKDEWLPKKIVELMGSQVVQVACGRRHTIVATSTGRIQTCGLAGSGQLGARPPPGSTYISIPRDVALPTEQYSNYDSIEDKSDKFHIVRIFAGGDRCFATVSALAGDLYDSRVINPASQILAVTLDRIKACHCLKEDDPVEQDMLVYLETVFKSMACMNGSFLTGDHYYCNILNSGVDIMRLKEIFEIIYDFKNLTLKDVIFQCFTDHLMKYLNRDPPDVETLRCFLIIPMYHEMVNPKRSAVLQIPFAKALSQLKPPPLKLLTSWYHAIPIEYFGRIVDIFKLVIVYFYKEATKNLPQSNHRGILINNTPIMPVFEALEKLNCMNNVNLFHKRVPPEAFYVHQLGELVDVKMDYMSWLSDTVSNRFYLCNYPFLFDALCKTSLLELDQAIQMHAAMNEAASEALFTMLQGGLPPSQYLMLTVSRGNIVADTLLELSHHGTGELKKPLKVKFHGEEAEDGGGVRKEFFLLLLKEILDPKYGMFQYYPDSRNVWFAEDSFEDERMYYLIGVICGLAIYNFTIINVNFPLALYKKLLKAPLTLEDLADLDPTLANSLQSLLDYDGDDVENVFGLNFLISREMYGSIKNHNLKENGANINVTKENKTEYVSLYVDFIFNKSIESKFNAFSGGFFKVCGGRVFKLFQPHELMTLVVGNEKYDWEELERVASYRGGYTKDDPVIRSFWEVFFEMSEEDKKRFLLFLSGCDRVPIQGMKAIEIIIQPTSDERFLPVAHTCFNLLDLPRYSTKEKLKYKLLQAMQQTQGFSLV